MHTVVWSSRRAGSGCTLRYEGGGLVGSSCDDAGTLSGISGWDMVRVLVYNTNSHVVLFFLFQCSWKVACGCWKTRRLKLSCVFATQVIVTSF
jgi:hypothetical protein